MNLLNNQINYKMNITTELLLPQIIDLRDNLVSRLEGKIERIVLYGSYARGEAGSDSDVDVLVVVKELSPSILEQTRSIRYEVMARYQYRPLLSMLVLSDEDWKALGKRNTGLKYHMDNEGIILWPKELREIR